MRGLVPMAVPKGENAKTPAAQLDRADHTARALNMTRRGMTVRAIAKVLGCGPTRVHELVKAARLAIPEAERAMLVAEIHERELGIIAKHWAMRVDHDSAKVIQASDKILMDLFGLAAPIRSEVAIGATITPAEARKVMSELFPGSVGPLADSPDDGGAPQVPPTE